MQHFQLHFEPEHTVHYQEPCGIWCKAKWQEIYHAPSIKRLQYNTEKYKNYIIVDVDDADIYAYKGKLPEPNIIVHNKNKSGGHLFWVLNRTVSSPYYTEKWKTIFKSFTEIAKGDTKAKGFIAKNINNNIDFNIEFIEPTAYDINALSSYAIQSTPKTIKSVSRANIERKTEQLIITEGRNCKIFDDLRLYAYGRIRASVNDNDFRTIVSSYAERLNECYHYPLESRELSDIIKSVTEWCIENKSKIKNYKKRGKMKLDDELSLKEKQKLSANYSSKLKATKNEMKIQVAIIEMKKQQMKINVSSVAKYTNLSRPTLEPKHMMY